jgi:hypothetical protein
MFSSSIQIRFRLKQCCLLITFCAALVLLFAGCSLPWQHADQAATSGHPPTTSQLFAALQKNFRSVSSFHVVMQVDNPGQASTSQIQIRAADGDVVMPDKVKAQATVMLSGQSVTVNLISIGSTQFITDPITGQWRVVKGVLDPSTLTNPNTGIISLAGKVQHATAPSSDAVNGVPCWLVTGKLDAKYIAFLTGGGVPAGTMLTTTICVGMSDSLPYEVKVTGIAAVGDNANTARTFFLSNYNQHVSITAPHL